MQAYKDVSNDVVFLYISVDKDRSRWLEAIETYDLKVIITTLQRG